MYSRNPSLFFSDLPTGLLSGQDNDVGERDATPEARAPPSSKLRIAQLIKAQQGPWKRPERLERDDAPPPSFPTLAELAARKKQPPSMETHSLAAKRRVYGVGPKPALKYGKAPLAAINTEHNDLEHLRNTMHRVGKNLPIQFLKASKHTDFAKRMATETVVRIVSANFEHARRRAFGMWQTFTDAHRAREHAFKRHRLEQLAGLARMLFLLQTKVEHRSRYILSAWAAEARARTHAIHTFHAIQIQCAWRQAMARRLRHRLYCAHLAACQRHSAIHSQRYDDDSVTCMNGYRHRPRLVRGFLARREASRRRVAKQEIMAATRIQRAYHNQVLYRAYRRQKQSRASALLQRVYRGHHGRGVALARRAALAQEATTYVHEHVLPAACANASRRIVSARRIQRCVRHATARTNYARAYPKLYARRRYFPACRIQVPFFYFVRGAFIQLN
ncbi:hypothetical protein SPRG_11679 [Saprolegnia parasitica CBS 223.65]|uniref:Uncharacterized protein n=1 Tax=Saprolegnia parasitica (strain CBS 223.65) TaxID=695850 RepID=A0A067C055_SAPPC|nr:hypothetical protein SPRG_11679 [Saprolegnia parasitica CBS 223.65]KDO22495.1 hypothetical protein SPRG_11679 [Saprolegnia parasitica CBS 223.65]|eukprot:XP_012206743.1 hypothetical protein SPRG_11679 [Saprolegnia parasitica CBS 223.65]